ncbi:MAG TPA: hypothetical protein VER97_03115, partial [Geodermatophilus sp.]|nr:hypothetical protein [Geodermatophilus sp.]
MPPTTRTLVAGPCIGPSGRPRAWRARPGYRVVQGACFELDAGLPFAPLRDLLRSLAADPTPEELVGLAG